MKRLVLSLVIAFTGLATLVVACLLLSAGPSGASAAETEIVACAPSNVEFKLGFKSLADQIPEVAGEPLEDEHWGAGGDSLQQTTTGLMAWRKADNWTAFTNGSISWINGPFGVQSRPNDLRFCWEAHAEQSQCAGADADRLVPMVTPPSSPVSAIPSPSYTAVVGPSSTSVPVATVRPSSTPIPTATMRPTSTPWPTATTRPTSTPWPTLAPPPTRTTSTGCCRVCTTGKACGDSCISRSYTCTKPPGCACDG